jgi:hypothetical protein
LNNYVTLTGVAQSITSSKTFNSSSSVSFEGNDQNNVLVHKTSAGLTGNLVSGHDYTHYNSRIRLGAIRGGGTDITKLAFLYSGDNGATFSDRGSIDMSNGQINTPSHGDSSQWYDAYQNGIKVGSSEFNILEEYREIDSTQYDIDSPRTKSIILVFNDSSNGNVVYILYLTDKFINYIIFQLEIY